MAQIKMSPSAFRATIVSQMHSIVAAEWSKQSIQRHFQEETGELALIGKQSEAVLEMIADDKMLELYKNLKEYFKDD
jgi:hypothetical protein